MRCCLDSRSTDLPSVQSSDLEVHDRDKRRGTQPFALCLEPELNPARKLRSLPEKYPPIEETLDEFSV